MAVRAAIKGRYLCPFTTNQSWDVGELEGTGRAIWECVRTHTYTHTHRPTKLSHIYIYYNWHSQNTHIHITFFFVSENQGAGDSTAHLCRFLLPWKNKDRAQQEIKLIEQPFWLGSKREGSMCSSTEIKCDDQSPAGLTLPQGSGSP